MEGERALDRVVLWGRPPCFPNPRDGWKLLFHRDALGCRRWRPTGARGGPRLGGRLLARGIAQAPHDVRVHACVQGPGRQADRVRDRVLVGAAVSDDHDASDAEEERRKRSGFAAITSA